MKKTVTFNKSQVQNIIVDHIKTKFETKEILSFKDSGDGILEVTFNTHIVELGFQVYFGSFSTKEDLENEFSITIPKDQEVVYADYDLAGYEGYSIVLLYEYSTKQYLITSSSHCSCNGLEWEEPTVTNIEAIRNMKNNMLYNNTLMFEVFLLNNGKLN